MTVAAPASAAGWRPDCQIPTTLRTVNVPSWHVAPTAPTRYEPTRKTEPMTRLMLDHLTDEQLTTVAELLLIPPIDLMVQAEAQRELIAHGLPREDWGDENPYDLLALEGPWAFTNRDDDEAGRETLSEVMNDAGYDAAIIQDVAWSTF